MNAIMRNIKIRNDGKDTENYMNVKKIGGDDGKTEVPSRAALGELQNRVQPRAAIGKDAVQKNLKDAKLPAIRAAKPRVDSHWKKGTFPATTTTNNQTNSTTATSLTTTTKSARQLTSGVLTRSNSVRLAATKATKGSSTKTVVSGGGIQRKGDVGAVKSKETKTMTTKLVENRLQQGRQAINKEKTQTVDTKLRREESNISRKTLTKLKAALARKVKCESTNETKKSAAITVEKIVPKVVESTHPKEEEKEEERKDAVINTIVPCSRAAAAAAAVNKNVRNIDEGDDDVLILVSEYVNDIYEYLFQLEIKQPIHKNHLGNQQVVTPKMRSVLLDWIHEVHSQFHLVVETFHMTVSIIDRYLQKVRNTQRSYLQLVGVTALFLASKYEELYPPSMADFVYMTDHAYNEQQFLKMEIQVFRTLDCNLSRPVSIHFLRRFSKAANVEDYQHAMSKYFLELAAIEYELASYRPSEIAAASLFLSLHMSKGDPKSSSGFNNSYWNATLEHYSHYTADHLRPIARKIAAIARHAPTAELTAVYNKYQSSKLYKASLRPVLYSKLMDSIIGNNS